MRKAHRHIFDADGLAYAHPVTNAGMGSTIRRDLTSPMHTVKSVLREPMSDGRQLLRESPMSELSDSDSFFQSPSLS